MISVSTTYNNIISGGGHYEWQIVNGANTFDITHIMSGKITQTQFEEVSIGNVLAAQVDLDLWNVTVDTSSTLSVQFRAVDDSSSSAWYTKGIFFIDTVETSPYSEVTHVTGFDAMLKAEVVYMMTGTWAATTTSAILTQVATDLGVSVESTTSTYISSNPITINSAPSMGENGTTDREMLSLIASLYGGNFIIDSSGKLKLIRLTTSPAETAAVGDAVVSLDASPAETVTRLRVWVSNTEYYAFPEVPLQTHTPENITTHDLVDITVKSAQFDREWEAIGGKLIDVNLPVSVDYTTARNIFNSVGGLSFIPYTANNAYVDPKYELGDGITIKDITSVIANQTISVDPLAPSDLHIQGEEVLQSYYPYIDPVKKEVARVEARTTASLSVLDDRIVAEVATRTEEDAALQSSITQTANSITSSVSQEITNATNNLQGQINTTNGNVTSLSSTVTQNAQQFRVDLASTTTQLQTYADGAAESAVSEYSDTVVRYLEYSNGVLRLGNNQDNFKTMLSNTELGFYQSNDKVAYISNNKLYITNAEITNNMQIGNYQWITDSTGRMSLKWVGG